MLGYLPFIDHAQLFSVYSPHQRTPVLIAAREGHVNIVTCLVEHGAHPNIKDDSEQNRYGVSEQEQTADCKLVLLVRVCFHSSNQRPLLLI